MPFPSRYGPVMNVVPWLIETDDEFPSARIKSAMKRGREGDEKSNHQSVLLKGCSTDCDVQLPALADGCR